MTDMERAIPGRNPDVGFLHCGGLVRSVNISTHTGFGKDVDAVALRAALDELADRASLLVARLRWNAFPGVHHSWIVPSRDAAVPIPFRLVDVSGEDSEGATAGYCAEGANRTIDPEVDPPFQVEVLRHADGSHDLVTTLHHAVYDGASCGFIFYAIKRLYAAALAGRTLGDVPLPRIVDLSEWRFAALQLGYRSRVRAGRHLARVVGKGLALLHQEGRIRPVPVPGRNTADDTRSLHRTLNLDLDDPELSGLGELLSLREATLNELLQAASARAFFTWGRRIGLLEDTLPMATTFNLRRPSDEEYALGNFETAAGIELKEADLKEPGPFLDAMSLRSRRQKGSELPLGHFLALSLLVRAPRRMTPGIVDKVASCGLLLFSYVGSDFSRRYLGHFGEGEEARTMKHLVLGCPGTGSGYVTSAPPLGLVLTIKRNRRRLALNFSLHSGIAPQSELDALAEGVGSEVKSYAVMGRQGR